VDWDTVDWDNLETNSTLGELKMKASPSQRPDQAALNTRRRKNEADRLHKYSWERKELPTHGKRARYSYVHADASIVFSMRDALRKCRKSAE